MRILYAYTIGIFSKTIPGFWYKGELDCVHSLGELVSLLDDFDSRLCWSPLVIRHRRLEVSWLSPTQPSLPSKGYDGGQRPIRFHGRILVPIETPLQYVLSRPVAQHLPLAD